MDQNPENAIPQSTTNEISHPTEDSLKKLNFGWKLIGIGALIVFFVSSLLLHLRSQKTQ